MSAENREDPRSAEDALGRGGLRVDGIEKSFGTVKVLHGVHVEVARGEIHALLGANGAGKSTLVKIVTGVLSPDAGAVEIDGVPLDVTSGARARDAGIAVVFQDPPLFPDLDVGENIFAGNYPKLSLGLLDRERCYERAGEVLARLGIEIDPHTLVKDLSVAEREFVAIARALEGESRVLLLDEPTASLTPDEARRLFEVVRNYRDHGGAVMFISHRLDEVRELADRVTVLRDGRNVLTGRVRDVSREQIAEEMLGRKLSAAVQANGGGAGGGEAVLSVRGLTLFRQFNNVSFDVRAGEIVLLAGLVGSGRTEVVETLVGLRKEDAGSVMVAGRELRHRDPRRMSRLGVVLVPEDRDAQGLVAGFSGAENIGMALPGRASRWGFLRRRAERDIAQQQLNALAARADATDVDIASLSGGTRQKVVLGKWLATRPKVLLLDEPTRGVDVGTKADIHAILKRLAQQQHMAVLAVSSDLEEVVQLADRVLVMRRGRLVAALAGEDMSEQAILLAASVAEDDRHATSGAAS
jgi:rhamnose transport system ATP-binding protein